MPMAWLPSETGSRVHGHMCRGSTTGRSTRMATLISLLLRQPAGQGLCCCCSSARRARRHGRREVLQARAEASYLAGSIIPPTRLH
jgi:hypothetical protein